MSYHMYDILVYNSQGTLKVAAVVKIVMVGEDSDVLYEMDNDEVIREDIVLKRIGNMVQIQDEFYG